MDESVSTKKEIQIDREQFELLADEIFMKLSGVDRQGKKFERMKQAAFQMRDAVQERVQVITECRYYDQFKLDGRYLTIDGQSFECAAFEQLDESMLRGVYLYVLSAGDFGLPEEKITNQLYADFWGTAFTDAVRELMRQELSKEIKLSHSFGPGFYGMDVSEMKKLNHLLDFKSIGLELRNDKIILPLKSCAGIIFSVNEEYPELYPACESCRGTYKSCRLCRLSREE